MTLTVTEGAVTLVPPGAPARTVTAGASFALQALELASVAVTVRSRPTTWWSSGWLWR